VEKIQQIVADIKWRERKLDIKIVPVWTPCTHTHIVEADLGSKMAASTDEWCIDREDLCKVFSQLRFTQEVDCSATRQNSICEQFFS